jgi:ABC-type dipeptide/oligopeptide/nickel transport system permease subunit
MSAPGELTFSMVAMLLGNVLGFASGSIPKLVERLRDTVAIIPVLLLA